MTCIALIRAARSNESRTRIQKTTRPTLPYHTTITFLAALHAGGQTHRRTGGGAAAAEAGCSAGGDGRCRVEAIKRGYHHDEEEQAGEGDEEHRRSAPLQHLEDWKP